MRLWTPNPSNGERDTEVERRERLAVQREHVVRLEERVEEQLPVALPRGRDALVGQERRVLPGVELGAQAGEPVVDVDGLVAVGPHRDEPVPLVDGQRAQAQRGGVEVVEALARPRLGDEMTVVDVVHPSVERAVERAGDVPATVRDVRAAVSACVHVRVRAPSIPRTTTIGIPPDSKVTTSPGLGDVDAQAREHRLAYGTPWRIPARGAPATRRWPRGSRAQHRPVTVVRSAFMAMTRSTIARCASRSIGSRPSRVRARATSRRTRTPWRDRGSPRGSGTRLRPRGLAK